MPLFKIHARCVAAVHTRDIFISADNQEAALETFQDKVDFSDVNTVERVIDAIPIITEVGEANAQDG